MTGEKPMRDTDVLTDLPEKPWSVIVVRRLKGFKAFDDGPGCPMILGLDGLWYGAGSIRHKPEEIADWRVVDVEADA